MLTTKLLKRNSFNILRRFYSDDVKPPPRGPENPLHRTARILTNDMKYLGTFFSKKKPTYNYYDSVSQELDHFPYHTDIVIIGGGIMGSSIAYFLKERAGTGLDVVVIEKDSTYKNASTVLSVGGLRQQFSLPENILMSQYAAQFFRDIKTNLGNDIDIQFTPHGYLLLATENTVEQLEKNFKLQQELNVKNELLTPSQLKRHFPWLNTDGIVLGCRGLADEGWFDPWMLLAGFRKKSMEIGVKYVAGEAIDFDFEICKNTILADEHFTAPYEKLRSINVLTKQGVTRSIQFAKVILATGADSGDFARKAKIGAGNGVLQVPLPIERRKRFVYCFNCQDDRSPGINTPMTFDPSGTYFRREGLGNNFIAGRAPSPDNEPDTKDLEVDHNFFDTDVWPNLAARVPAFEAVKVTNAWAGFYEFNTFDENGIIGTHPYHSNMIIAAGFSGHGIQQAPAVGRAVAEILLDGEFTTIDLSRLSFDRLLVNEPMIETNCF